MVTVAAWPGFLPWCYYFACSFFYFLSWENKCIFVVILFNPQPYYWGVGGRFMKNIKKKQSCSIPFSKILWIYFSNIKNILYSSEGRRFELYVILDLKKEANIFNELKWVFCCFKQKHIMCPPNKSLKVNKKVNNSKNLMKDLSCWKIFFSTKRC